MLKYLYKKVALFAFVSVLLLSLMFDARFVEIVNADQSGTLDIDSDYTFTSNIYEPIVVTADNITIDGNGYTLEGPGSGIGFNLTGRDNVTIENVNIKGWTTGISLEYCSSNIMSGNNITANNGKGIYLLSSSNNTISGNYITANNYHGIEFYYYSNNNTISGNYITANKDGGIDLFASSYNRISENNITNNKSGIGWAFGDYNTISRNSITNNVSGIDFFDSSYSIISGNNITNTRRGIVFYGDYNTISGNNITANNWHGIYLGGSYNIIHGNNITDNFQGIYLYPYESSNNTIYHNNFIGNTLQVYDPSWDDPSLCPSIYTWDNGYPSGGNYWSDYAGTDLYRGPYQNETGSDGIGDTPYVIDEYNQDRYPFMDPWPFWATTCSVWTTDADGTPKVKFDPAEMVYVHWDANGMINMTVYAPDGVTTDQEWTFLLTGGVVSFVPSHGMGIYEIDCTGARPTPIAISTFLVIPQLPFLSSLLTLVTTLAVFMPKKRRSH